ncbi:FAD/NAD(P)-binding domain-containing protein [Marasmius fiardii PR-910]|nr:FAD/NAD(P)-binding domain-containing protein [Marasmius fiardii PR-910]
MVSQATVYAFAGAFLCHCFNVVYSSQQRSFQAPPVLLSDSESYQFQWPIRKVAIIGAGVGGLVSYREFLHAGYAVTLFERDEQAGGVWHYTEEIPLNAPVPNAVPASADYTPCLPPRGVELPYEVEYADQDPQTLSEQRRAHRAPKPIWSSLKSNAPAPDQQIRDWKWPEDTPWELPQEMIQRYVRSFASLHGINTNDNNPNVFYNTRVELVEKNYVNNTEAGWTLTLKQFVKTGERSSKTRWWKENFDAIAVATGRYNSPSLPSIPGLSEWVTRYPGYISHSRQYRRPEIYQNKSVLVVGGASSGAEIGIELSPFVSKLYVSTRPDKATAPHYPLSFYVPKLPKNTTMIGEIKQFLPAGMEDKPMSQGKIELTNGTIISGVDHIIFSTGFRYTYPFFPQYLNPTLGPNDTARDGSIQPLVTDGSHVRSLYLDMFYIEEPTIGFININAGMQSFVYGEYLAVSLASVWNNRAKLPTTKEMWRRYHKHLDEKGGYSKHFQFLGSQVAHDMMRYLVGWVNEAAVKNGGKQIDGPSVANNEILAIWALARFGTSEFNDVTPIGGFLPLANPSWDDSTIRISWSEMKKQALDSMYRDYW